MKRLLLVIGIFIFILPLYVSSQSPDENHDKYWYYRYRLKTHFMKIGKEPGESLIASERAGHEDVKDVTFGDQTVNLGMYISILAMEYHLLASNGQNTSHTRNELFHALYAVNRLDMNAESFFRNPSNPIINPQPGDLNGFFVKDDATQDFFTQNISHFNSDNIKSNNTVSSIKSQWEDCILANNTPGKSDESKYGLEMSQDQYYYILMGCRFVNKFIPSSVTYKGETFQDGVKEIRREAANIAHRITSHINWTRFTNRPSVSRPGNPFNMYWQITNPVRNKQVVFPQNPFHWSYATAEITNDAAWPYFSKTQSSPSSGIAAQHTPASRVTGASLWPATRNWFASQDNAHMVGLLNALMARPNADPRYSGEIAAWDIQHVPLIKQVVHGGNNPFFTNRSYEDMLNEASCTGPFVFDWKTGDVALSPMGGLGYEWSTSDRALHPERRGGNSSQFIGEFPGLDYMLYHNLYYIINSSSYNNPLNRVQMEVDIALPFIAGSFQFGTFSHPLEVKVFEKIEADNIIGQIVKADVSYRATEQITFKPGFQVFGGSKFRGYLKRFECSTGGSSGYRGVPKDTLQTDYYSLKFHNDIQPTVDYDYQFNQSEENVLIENDEQLIKRLISLSEISLFPNPSRGILNINFNKYSDLESLSIKVFDVKGKLLKTSFISIDSKIDLSNFKEGVYFINFYDKNENKISEQKVIKI